MTVTSGKVAMRRTMRAVSLAALLASALVAPAARASEPPPGQDPFYAYQGTKPLARIMPGTVLKTRRLQYHVAGIPLPVKAVQLLYRSAGASGQPTTNVTSVLLPPSRHGTPNIISYQSAYDSLSPNDEPSYAIKGGLTLGGLVASAESVLIAPGLQAGNAVVVPDTEGQTADLGAGPEYGYNTDYSLRAVLSSPATGLAKSRKIALVGYSGGGVATEWASEMAPRYTPDVNRRIVAATYGGVAPDPIHNLHYVSGSAMWAPVMAMTTMGIARAYGVDLAPYLSRYGAKVYADLHDESIIAGFAGDLFSGYSGMTWSKLAGPAYQSPESIPLLVTVADRLIMGSRGTPTEPVQIYQGDQGELDGTNNDQPGIGAGDGVMIAGDVRTLAREYCGRGVPVDYVELPLEHGLTGAAWFVQAYSWVADRFAGKPARQNCSSIKPGNSLEPIG